MDDPLQKWIDAVDYAANVLYQEDEAVALKELSGWLVAHQDDIEGLFAGDSFQRRVKETEQRLAELEAKMKDKQG